MAFLAKGRKEDLKILAEDLGEDVQPEFRIIQLKNLIMNSKNYEEDFAKDRLEEIIRERVEKEREDREREEKLRLEEKEEKLRLEDREREEKLRLEDREREERIRLEQIELEKFKIQNSIRENSPQFENIGIKKPQLELQKLMQKYNPKEGDISLYLVIFERQAKRLNLDIKDWVTHLMSLLPIEIIELIAREPEEKSNEYDFVKKLILKRFKLSPETFRLKFVQHQRKPESTWKDFIFELTNYFEEWLQGLEIDNFQKLKDLMISDQAKRRVGPEVRDHFVDEWVKISSPSQLCEMLDNYESVVKVSKKPFYKNRQDAQWPDKKESQGSIPKKVYDQQERKTGFPAREITKWEKGGFDERFDKRRPPRCFECNSPNHLRPTCPKLSKKPQTSPLNHLGGGEKEEDLLAPYISSAKVNGVTMSCLRDSGATIDIICRKYITPQMITGEHVWVQQPLDPGPVCLPLAHVEIEGESGTIKTKAGVVSDELDKGYYLLGNRTAAIIADQMSSEFCPPVALNAVVTRSQTKQAEKENELKNVKETDFVEGDVPVGINIEENNYDNVIIPEVDENAPEVTLINISKNDFKRAQEDCESLKECFKLAEAPDKDSEKNTYCIENEVLLKVQTDKLGNMKRLLVVPETLRERIKSLCHEGTSAHLGTTKSKDKMGRYFYWPGCFKDMEDYVRTCDSCQRAGKPGEKKKAPLKLVPVIQEVFSRINIDACGPLPLTERGNRYMLTAICMASKYPEAIPLPDISSVTITNALLNIFSRMGFPKEVQCDLGTSFTSALTSEFFERFGIKVIHSSVHHPQSNPVERFHRTIKRLLRALCLEAESEWEEQLPSALFALRTVTHESTGFTPAELVHGKNLRTPETLLYERWVEPEEDDDPVTEYVVKLVNRLKRCQEVAINKMETKREVRKLWYDKNATKREFKEGDLVLILATSKPNKLAAQWIGPGVIQGKLSETNYIVKVPGKKERSQIFHINMLKQYHRRPDLVNFLSCVDQEEPNSEIDFPYIDSDPNIYNFDEIVKNSHLEARLEQTQIDQLQNLLRKFWKAFSNVPGQTDLVEHDIELESNKTVRSKPYRASQRQNEILKKEIQRMLDMGIIEIGESDYTSPMILVEAPNRDPRPCVDYRRLNEVTRTQYYPLPNIEDRLETVAAAKYITLLDFSKGYWQIRLTPNAQRLAAFVTTFGTYRPLRLPFGLKNAPYFFSKLMYQLLEGCEEFAVPYLDDVAIYSDNWESHLKHVDSVLQRISKANLTIKPSKCRFAQDHVIYLGHEVGQGYRRPTDLKIKAVQDFPIPKTKTDIRAFLGLAGYYSHYIPNFSGISAPLTDALKGQRKKGEINWTEDCDKAFKNLKEKLINRPVLFSPDFSKDFIVQTDASDTGRGIVLTQISGEEEHPVLYLSKKFSETERKYSTTEKECACIIFAVKRLYYYLDGRKFTIQTDHNPLTWLKTNASANQRLMRWALALQAFDFNIQHRSGTNNKNADGLSRADSPT